MRKAKTDAPAGNGARVTQTFHVDVAQLEELRDAVVYLSGPPVRLTITAFVRQAFEAELDRLRKAHNKGKPFPPRGGDVRRGRPVGA